MTWHTDETKQGISEREILAEGDGVKGEKQRVEWETGRGWEEGALSISNLHQGMQLNSTAFILYYSII